jgi:DnaJ-domain-containing protein 1
MPYFLAGLALLVLLIFAARLLAKANPRLLAGALRKLSGIIALGAAGFLLLRGALPLAIPLGLFGFSLIRPSAFGFGPFASSSKSPGGTSHVQTESLEMELDHDSGEMEGMVLKGAFEGRMLSSLSDAELKALLDELRGTDQQAEALMQAYLDWRIPDWREAESGKDEEKSQPRSRKPSGHMSVDEAYALLGLKRGASEEEIGRAHRQMMKKFHPDQGGSTYLASRINEAKDVLLGR